MVKSLVSMIAAALLYVAGPLNSSAISQTVEIPKDPVSHANNPAGVSNAANVHSPIDGLTFDKYYSLRVAIKKSDHAAHFSRKITDYGVVSEASAQFYIIGMVDLNMIIRTIQNPDRTIESLILDMAKSSPMNAAEKAYAHKNFPGMPITGIQKYTIKEDSVQGIDTSFTVPAGAKDVLSTYEEILKNPVSGKRTIIFKNKTYELNVFVKDVDCEGIECIGIYANLMLDRDEEGNPTPLVPYIRDILIYASKKDHVVQDVVFNTTVRFVLVEAELEKQPDKK